MTQFQKTLGQTAGPKDGQILFHRTLPATTRGPTSTTAVDEHLKVKDREYNVGLTKNYCITVIMLKISSIHEGILKIQLILGPHQIATPNFDYDHLKLSEITFNFQFISQF